MRELKITPWRCAPRVCIEAMAARPDHGQAKLFKVACWFGEPPVAACRGSAYTFRRIEIPPLALPGAGIGVVVVVVAE